MRFGTQYPMVARWGPAGVVEFAQEAEAAGVDFLTVSGHVLSTEAGRFPEKPPHVYEGPYYDAFLTFAYLAGATERLGFRTSILILPLYPAALVAKQVAELSILTNGRMELGVGISWNEHEYRAFGQDVHKRGRLLDEQLFVIRELWTRDVVTFTGSFHQLDGVGIGRLPSVVPPVWLGGTLIGPNMRRIVQYADGWIPAGDPTGQVAALRGHLREAGRDPDDFGVSVRLDLTQGDAATWAGDARRLQEAGVTQLVLDPGEPESAAAAVALVTKALDVVRAEVER